MKLGPTTKHDNKDKNPLKKIDDGLMLANCDVIVIFPICRQFGAMRKPYSGCIVCKTYIFKKSNQLSCKN